MSGWVLLVRELHDRGPLCERDFTALKSGCAMLAVHVYLMRAHNLGLVERPGRHGSDSPQTYTLTERGVDFCEGRLEFVVPRGLPRGSSGGRPKGSTAKPRATWLAALPRANEIRLSGAPQAALR